MRSLVIIACVALAGCSLGYIDNESGGSSNLPTLGAGPFAKPQIDFDTPAEEPFVIVQNRVSLFEPTVLERDDGGFRLWFSRQEDDSDEVQIWTGELPDILELPDTQFRAALVADQSWEEGRVSAPSVVELADGRLFMLYEGGITAPGIGLAISTDGGANWQKSDANPVIPDAISPGLGDARGRLLAVFLRPANDQEIFAADSDDGASWEIRSESVIGTRVDDGDAFDQQSLSSPSL
ncbi:MAG: glycoside hydrolase, partial [Deltaproteobacteria bacterium]|nr:glycoside hydrolase [Deltaproteobacteria bacterium]